MKTAAGTLAAGAALPALAQAATPQAPTGETLVAQLYKSLSDEQKKKICFPFDHELRGEVDNNWHIVKDRVSEVLTPDQRDLNKQIFMAVHSPEYAQKVYDQVTHDSGKRGFDSGAIAIFGEPGTGKFEWVYTGRHCTRRCDGDSVQGAAFGGPIFYGHAAKSFNEGPKHEGNAYWFQAERANKLFQALDGKQREKALRTDARAEDGMNTIKLTGDPEKIPGLGGEDMTADQKALLRDTMSDLLAPFREADRKESMKLIDLNGGLDALHIAYYKNMDIGDDGVWDVWQIEGPTMLWYFRGKPHVHTWVKIQREPDPR